MREGKIHTIQGVGVHRNGILISDDFPKGISFRAVDGRYLRAERSSKPAWTLEPIEAVLKVGDMLVFETAETNGEEKVSHWCLHKHFERFKRRRSKTRR